MAVALSTGSEHKSPALLPESFRRYKYCTVIPVFNSALVLAETLRRTQSVFENNGLDYEIVVVNDASTDESWQILRQTAKNNPHIVAINLMRNYGQHSAILCGLRHSTADYIVTIDDDLQNPPEMMIALISKALEGYDFVCGKFYSKRHAWHRHWASQLISLLNEHVFGKPAGFSLTNFRLFDRRLADRICQYRTPYPYINGLAVSLASNMANVDVEHHERIHGKSTYSLSKLIKLAFTILFTYSSFPMRCVCLLALLVSIISFAIGIFTISQALFLHVKVPGKATIVLLLSIYGGLFSLMFGMLGEYLVRVLNTASEQGCYHVREKINHG